MRDYAIVWMGTKMVVRDDDVASRILSGSHAMVRRAEGQGLGSYLHTFGWQDDGTERRLLLIGVNLARLGFKEGRSEFAGTPARLERLRATVQKKLFKAGIRRVAALHVLFHTEGDS